MSTRSSPAAHRLAALFLSLLLLPSAGRAADVVDEAPGVDPAALRAFVDEYVPAQMAEYAIPGVTLAVVQGGDVTLVAGFGSADRQAGRSVDGARTVFRVGSVSKALTATAVLHLVESGAIGLHDDLRPWLGDLPVEPPLTVPLTLHHLLTFTGGFNERLFGQHTLDAGAFLSLEDYLRRFLPPRFEEPGRIISYNDYQTSLAGLAVQRISGERFEDYVARQVLAPLGMSATTFEQVDLPAGVEAGLASSYRMDGDRPVPYPRDYIMTPPAAGLWTSAADMARYLRAVLGQAGDGGAVLSPAGWAAQVTPQFRHHPELPAWGYGFAADRRKGFDVWFKDGQAWGFHARLLLVPDLDLGVFSAINRTILGAFGAPLPAARFNRELGDAILERFFQEPDGNGAASPAGERTAPSPTPDFAGRAALYTGTYRNAVAARHTFEKLLGMTDDITVGLDGEGRLQVWGLPWVEIRPGVAQYAEGGANYIGFDGDGVHPYRYLFVSRGAYERVPWYGTSTATMRIGAVATGFFVLATLIFGGLFLRRRRQAAGGLAALALLAALLNLAFLAGFGAVFALVDVQRFFLGPPAALTAVLAAPVLSGAVLVLLAGMLIRSRRRASLTPTVRVMLGTFILASIPFYLWLNAWNLLGWRYG